MSRKRIRVMTCCKNRRGGKDDTESNSKWRKLRRSEQRLGLKTLKKRGKECEGNTKASPSLSTTERAGRAKEKGCESQSQDDRRGPLAGVKKGRVA